jgi:hypothetical protein
MAIVLNLVVGIMLLAIVAVSESDLSHIAS